YSQKAIARQKYDDDLTNYNNAGFSYTSALSEQKRLESEREKMIIKSPLKGVVISKDVNVGEWVSSGGSVASVAALTYEAKVYVPESVLPYIRAGQTVTVETGRRSYEGIVLSVNSKGDPATRLFLTRIYLGQDPDLKEGILTTALIPSGSRMNALLVSRDAVVERNSVKGVFKVGSDERVRFIPVKIVGYNGGYLAVTSAAGDGLSAGDRVVLDGNNAVNNGVKVKITSKIG
ncbi:MAG: efflux RND transporter periplasmic adaptor subunit, partial [Mucispirillum sp.]|nr:efflux RND transporter periplasmic adaptor subunit [Mucispirillum sp.]